MRKIKLILLTIGLIQSLTTFSEGCRQRITNINAVAIGLKNSDIVFLGDLIKADTEKLTYSFKILELYKGKYKSDTIYGKAESKYSMFPVDNGLWIVYAFFNKDSSIVIDLCGSTMPMKYAHYFGPPPHGIVHAGFSGLLIVVARKKGHCNLIRNRLVIPHDTIPSTLGANHPQISA